MARRLLAGSGGVPGAARAPLLPLRRTDSRPVLGATIAPASYPRDRWLYRCLSAAGDIQGAARYSLSATRDCPTASEDCSCLAARDSLAKATAPTAGPNSRLPPQRQDTPQTGGIPRNRDEPLVTMVGATLRPHMKRGAGDPSDPMGVRFRAVLTDVDW